MQVSVIIPVYNAAQFLHEAVQSALNQPETAEILLIEDGSTDDSFAMCQNLCSTDGRIKLLTHPEHRNQGAGASRNLGIASAQYPFIAFLDADDIWLPSRFAVTQEVLKNYPDADGVYETIGASYDDPVLRTLHLSRTSHEMTGLSSAVPPEKVFRALATGKYGHISLVGFIVRRDALSSDLLFDTSLKQCQDSDWFLRIALQLTLYSGKPGHPVAMRRVHAGNRVLQRPEAIRFQRAFLKKSMRENFFNSKDKFANLYLVARYISWSMNGRLRHLGVLSRPSILFATGIYLLVHPALLFHLLFH